MLGLLTLGIGYWAGAPPEAWQTMAFTTLALAQMGSTRHSHFQQASLQGCLFSNPLLVGSVLLTLVMQLAASTFPSFSPS